MEPFHAALRMQEAACFLRCMSEIDMFMSQSGIETASLIRYDEAARRAYVPAPAGESAK